MHKIYRDESTKYYLYRHIRVDKNLPFYIGIGIKRKFHSKTFESEYERANNFICRNNFWKNIKNKTEIKVEILYESNCKKEIVKKEIEFISMYKRKEFGGTLTNLTDGGEYPTKLSTKIEKQRRLKISNALKKRKRKQSTFKKISESKKKIVLRCNLEGDVIDSFNSVTEASNSINLTISSISKCLKNEHAFKKYTAGGYRWKIKPPKTN